MWARFSIKRQNLEQMASNNVVSWIPGSIKGTGWELGSDDQPSSPRVACPLPSAKCPSANFPNLHSFFSSPPISQTLVITLGKSILDIYFTTLHHTPAINPEYFAFQSTLLSRVLGNSVQSSTHQIMTCNLPYNCFSQPFQIPLLPRLGGINSILLTQISPLLKRTHFLSPSQITPGLNSTYSWNLLHFFSVLHNCFLGDSFGRQSIPTAFPKSGAVYLLTFPQNNSYSSHFLEVKWWICLIAVAAGFTGPRKKATNLAGFCKLFTAISLIEQRHLTWLAHLLPDT